MSTAQNAAHAGKIIDDAYFKAHCKCGWRSKWKEFRYEAADALFDHFRERGTLKGYEPDMADYNTFGEHKQRSFNYLLKTEDV